MQADANPEPKSAPDCAVQAVLLIPEHRDSIAVKGELNRVVRRAFLYFLNVCRGPPYVCGGPGAMADTLLLMGLCVPWWETGKNNQPASQTHKDVSVCAVEFVGRVARVPCG